MPQQPQHRPLSTLCQRGAGPPLTASVAALFLFAGNEDFRSLSIQVAGSCAVESGAGGDKAVCLLASLLGRKIALLEIHVAALVTSQRRHAAGRGLSVLPRAHVLSTSPLRFRPAEERAQPALQAPSGSGSVLGRCAPSVGCSPGPRASAPFSCFVNSCWAARKFHDSSLLVFLHFSASHMGVTCRLW